jgi:hypothetical protein
VDLQSNSAAQASQILGLQANIVDLTSIQSNVVAAWANVSVGTVAQPWSYAYVTNLQVNEDIVLGGQLLDANGNPVQLDLTSIESNVAAANADFTLGTVAQPWSHAYVASLQVDDDIVLGGQLLDANGNPVQLDLTSIESNVAAANADFTLGTVVQPWDFIYGNTVSVSSSLVLDGTVGSSLVPSVSTLYDLGNETHMWNRVVAANIDGAVDANALYGTIDAPVILNGELEADAVLTGELDAEIVLSGELEGQVMIVGGSIDNIPFRLPAGTSSEPSIRFLDDATTGVYLPGSGTLGVTGNLVPAADGMYSLGNATHRWSDVYVGASSVYIGNAAITSIDDRVMVSNLDSVGTVTAASFVGDGSGLTGIVLPLSITSVRVSDASGTPLDDTAVDTATGGYVLVHGSGYKAASVVQIDGVSATSTTFLDSTSLLAHVQPKAAGTYDVSVVRQDGQSTTVSEEASRTRHRRRGRKRPRL